MPLARYGVLAGAVADEQAAGGTDTPQVAAPVQLGNQGGQITLVNPDGLKADGVAHAGQGVSWDVEHAAVLDEN